jgi:hypothetical protein
MRKRLGSTILIMTLSTACSDDNGPAENFDTSLPDLFNAHIGTVDFPVSCTEPAAEVVERGLVLLHHMMYTNARLVFGMAENLDPNCAMSLWGQAMTLIHPLWSDLPTREELALGHSLAQRARAMDTTTPRESDYLTTIEAYFEAREGDTEITRLARFEQAWRNVAEQHPDDLEAQTLFALAHIATADLNDKSFVKQQRAGAVTRAVLAQVPEHPGAHHYLIHAFDNPVLAADAESVADRYGALTPAVPHATHMMTHIYTRLGAWDKSIEWNNTSADAAWEICAEFGEVIPHYPHALDYLAYAHLQLGADRQALAVVEDVAALEPPYSALNPAASAYAFAALPARYHLERRDWQAAAALEPRAPASFPWDDTHLAYVAITYFARALGHARLGELEKAETDLGEMRTLRDEIARQSAYWAQQVEIQTLAVEAWINYAAGDREAGLVTMRAAAALEAATEKDSVSPGEVLPAIELLGDMLLDTNDDEAALAAYQQSLQRTPGRLNSLYGAARAAERSGKSDEARLYYTALMEALGEREERPEMVAAASSHLRTG